MNNDLINIGILVVFALLLVVINKALSPSVGKFLTYWAMWATLGGAGYFVLKVVLA